jgi:Chaperone of endosialidase
LSRLRTEDIPAATRQKGRPPFRNSNTADGADALVSNNTGGGDNTATGYNALAFNTTGSENMAIGAAALVSNTEGVSNTASGFGALFSNTTGSENTATGVLALYSNVDGVLNTAIGYLALRNNDTGDNNTAIGSSALFSNVGNVGRNNTAIGAGALSNNTAGQGNIALGRDAGINVTTASNVICIGHPGQNMSNRCYIGNIFTNGIFGVNVEIDGTGQIGVPPSSRRFKKEIKAMDQASEAILGLKPVTFHYKSDTTWTRQFGLIAEEVEKVNPDLIVRDKDGNLTASVTTR